MFALKSFAAHQATQEAIKSTPEVLILETSSNTLLDQKDNRIQKIVQRFRKCNPSSHELESKTLDTYITCCDPQLQGFSFDP